MTKEDFKKLRETFPWTYTIEKTKTSGFIRVFDKDNREVDLLTLIEFVIFISQQLQK